MSVLLIEYMYVGAMILDEDIERIKEDRVYVFMG